jgi:hypothetical protein
MTLGGVAVTGIEELRAGFFVSVLVLLAASCSGQDSGAAELRVELAEVEGRYEWSVELGRYEFSSKARLEAIITSSDAETVLRALVGCLDDQSSSRATLDGVVVPMGVVCYEALSQLVYYEPTSPDGDIAEQWAGHLSPTADPEALRAAREAWEAVVASGGYVFL